MSVPAPQIQTMHGGRRSARTPVSSVVVIGCTGGVGATTVAALVWTALTWQAGTPVGAVARADDWLAARLPWAPQSRPGTIVVVDAGPHVGDDVLAHSDRVVLACAADRIGRELGAQTAAAYAERGHPVAAVAAVERYPGLASWQHRRQDPAGPLRDGQVLVRFDPHLASNARLSPDHLTKASTLTAQQLGRLAVPPHG